MHVEDLREIHRRAVERLTKPPAGAPVQRFSVALAKMLIFPMVDTCTAIKWWCEYQC
jgi:hypothetical protein